MARSSGLTVCAELLQTLLEMFILENCVYSQVNDGSGLIDHPPMSVLGFSFIPLNSSELHDAHTHHY